LAKVLIKVGKFDEAERLLRRVITSREKCMGEKHLSTLETLETLAILYEGEGNIDEAKALFRRIFTACQETIGPGHPFTEQASTALRRLIALRESGNVTLDKSEIAKNVSPNPSHFTSTEEGDLLGPRENLQQKKEKGKYPSRVTEELERGYEKGGDNYVELFGESTEGRIDKTKKSVANITGFFGETEQKESQKPTKGGVSGKSEFLSGVDSPHSGSNIYSTLFGDGGGGHPGYTYYQLWTCCYCGDGPYIVGNIPVCANVPCGHGLCSNCGIEDVKYRAGT